MMRAGSFSPTTSGGSARNRLSPVTRRNILPAVVDPEFITCRICGQHYPVGDVGRPPDVPREGTDVFCPASLYVCSCCRRDGEPLMGTVPGQSARVVWDYVSQQRGLPADVKVRCPRCLDEVVCDI